MYVAFLAPGVIIFSDHFLSVRPAPLGNTASWLCIVPWSPKAGPLIGLYLFIWVAAQVIAQTVLYRRKRRPGILPNGPLSQIDMIRLSLIVQAIGVVLDIIMSMAGQASFSVTPLTSVAVGLIYAIALVRERITADVLTTHAQ